MPTLIHAFDPLCGWCYAFAAEWPALRAALGPAWTVHLATGGLVLGEDAVPIGRKAGYLRPAMAQLEAHTGVRFGTPFRRLLDDGTWAGSSLPAIAAIEAARTLAPDREVDVAHALCVALYAEGRVPEDPATLDHVASALGLDAAAWHAALAAPDLHDRTVARILDARHHGVRSYPSFFVEDDSAWLPVHAGWARARDLATLLTAA